MVVREPVTQELLLALFRFFVLQSSNKKLLNHQNLSNAGIEAMSIEEIIQVWKDPNFRNSLSEENRLLVPERLEEMVELADAQLKSAAGELPPSDTKFMSKCIVCC